jgi:hypothetical protein
VDEVQDQVPNHPAAEQDNHNPPDHLGGGQRIFGYMTLLHLSGMRH